MNAIRTLSTTCVALRRTSLFLLALLVSFQWLGCSSSADEDRAIAPVVIGLPEVLPPDSLTAASLTLSIRDIPDSSFIVKVLIDSCYQIAGLVSPPPICVDNLPSNTFRPTSFEAAYADMMSIKDTPQYPLRFYASTRSFYRPDITLEILDPEGNLHTQYTFRKIPLRGGYDTCIYGALYSRPSSYGCSSMEVKDWIGGEVEVNGSN